MENKNLSVIACANNWTLWQYMDKTISVDEMEQVSFFDKVQHLMAIGDIIYLVANDTVKQLWVKTLNPVTLEEMGE